MAVTEVESGENLPEEPPRLFRREAPFLHEVVEQFAARDDFQNQVAAKKQISKPLVAPSWGIS